MVVQPGIACEGVSVLVPGGMTAARISWSFGSRRQRRTRRVIQITDQSQLSALLSLQIKRNTFRAADLHRAALSLSISRQLFRFVEVPSR
jgi:hypothetical protein